MSTARLSLSQLSELIAADVRKGRLAVLAGAGVSMVKPTRLPGGDHLRDIAVQGLATTSELRSRWQQLKDRPAYRRLLPELAFQRLWEYLGDNLEGFFQILKLAAPNPVHALLARLASDHNVPLTTTNFDLLIEEASISVLQVTHLHGSLRQSDSMVVRLNQVGRPLPVRVATRFQEVVAGKDLLIVGYSGRDTDVMAQLSTSRIARVFWLVRSDRDPAMKAAHQCPLPTRVAVGDLAELPRAVARTLPLQSSKTTPTGATASLDTRRNQALISWKRSVPVAMKYLGLGAICLEAGDFGSATRLALEASQRVSVGTGADYIVSAAGILRLTARFSAGLSLVEGALAGRWGAIPSLEKARALNVAGLLLLEKERPAPAKALARFRQGERTLRAAMARAPLGERNQQLLGRLLNNSGLALERLERFDEAEEAYRESLGIKRTLGDIVGEAQSAANLSLALYRQRDFRRAGYWRRQAQRAIERYELDFLHVYLKRRQGTIACEQGRIRAGLRILGEALSLAQTIEGVSFDEDLIQRALQHYSS